MLTPPPHPVQTLVVLDKAKSMSEALAAAVAPVLGSSLEYTQLAKHSDTSATLDQREYVFLARAAHRMSLDTSVSAATCIMGVFSCVY